MAERTPDDRSLAEATTRLAGSLDGVSRDHDEDDDELGDGTFGALLREIAAPGAVADAFEGPRPGEVLDARFEIVAELGRGGMGRVYVARDLTFGRRVAVKLWHGQLAVRDAFHQEARATARLSHPAIVTVFHSGEWSGRPFLVLEYLRGETLAARLRAAAGALTLEDALEIAWHIAQALAHAHAHGVIHRDLKPGNVLVLDDGRIKVVDFGIAHIALERDGWARGMDRAGTPGYMAPEQRVGSPVQSARVDVWAFGVVLGEMLPPAQRPAALTALIERCTALDPDARPADGGALLEALRAASRAADPPRELAAAPYRYLEAFDEADARWFFGRRAEARRLRAMLRRRALVAVVGPSGAGKSSLVRAGLLAALRGSERWEAIAVRPSRAPLQALWRTLVGAGLAPADARWPPEGVPLEHLPGRVGACLRAAAARAPEGAGVVLIVDPLEELFTQPSVDAGERGLFLQCLLAVGDDPGSRLRVVLVMREDFLVRLGELPGLRDEVVANLFLLGPPDRRAMHEALCAPAERCGVRFAPALVDAVLDTLVDEPTPLPLLQFTASRLWDSLDGGEREVALSRLEALGGLGGIVVAHAEGLLRELPGPGDQAVLRGVMRALCAPDGTRRRVSLRALSGAGSEAEPEAVRRVVEHFVAGRLLTTSRGDEGDTWVEIAHEILCARWDRLRQWLDEDRGAWRLREALARTAAHWDTRGRPDSLLWSQGLLVEIGELEARWALTPLEHGFVEASRAAAAALEAAADRTRQRVRLARSRELATAASEAVASDPMRALLLAVEAARTVPSVQAQGALYEALDAVHERAVLRHPSRVASFALAPDGRHLAALGLETTIALWRTADGQLEAVLEGHEERVTGAVFSPDGRSLLSWSVDGCARLWRTADGQLEAVLEGHEERVTGGAFSPDGATVSTWSLDGSARLWERRDGALRAVLRGDEDGARAAVARFSSDGSRVVTSAQGACAWLWSARGERVARLEGHTERVVDLRVGSRGQILTVGTDPAVLLWCARDGRLEGRVPVDGTRVTRARFDPDGGRVAVGLADGRVVVCTSAGLQARVLEGHEDLVTELVFSSGGADALLASASLDGSVRVWPASGEGERVLREHRSRITAMGFLPGHRPRLWTTSIDGSGVLYDVRGEVAARLLGHEGSINQARLMPDGGRILTAGDDGTVRLWSVTNEPMPRLRGHGDAVLALAFAPGSSRRLASASADTTARVWDVDAPDGLEQLCVHHQRAVGQLLWLPDGVRLATATAEGTLRVFDTSEAHAQATLALEHEGAALWSLVGSRDGRLLVVAAGNEARVWSPEGALRARLRTHEHTVTAVALDPSGRFVATASVDRSARVCELAAPDAPARALEGHRGRLTCAVFSPHPPPGAAWLLATADGAGRVGLWRADGADALWLDAHEMLVSWLGFSPDGALLATASWDGRARLWSAQGEALGELAGHDGALQAAAFSPDGTRLATASDDGTARVWTLAEGGALQAVLRQRGGVRALAWSDDGTRLALGDASGEVRVVETRPAQLLALAEARASRALSDEERRRYDPD